MADIPNATQVTPAGLSIETPATAATSTMALQNTGKEAIIVKNGSGGSINVTITLQNGINDGGGALSVTSRVVAVPDGDTKIIGPFNPQLYNDTTGKVNFAFSTTTGVVTTAIKLG